MIATLIFLVDLVFRILILLLITHVVISYFMSPFHRFRMWVDRIVEPMLAPIRRVIPMAGMLDFSPIVLLIILQLLNAIIKNILLKFI